MRLRVFNLTELIIVAGASAACYMMGEYASAASLFVMAAIIAQA